MLKEQKSYKKTLAQNALTFNEYALKVQTSENILRQIAPSRLPAKPSYDKFRTDTELAHFLRVFLRGNKGNYFKK